VYQVYFDAPLDVVWKTFLLNVSCTHGLLRSGYHGLCHGTSEYPCIFQGVFPVCLSEVCKVWVPWFVSWYQRISLHISSEVCKVWVTWFVSLYQRIASHISRCWSWDNSLSKFKVSPGCLSEVCKVWVPWFVYWYQ